MVAQPAHRFREQFQGALEHPTGMVREYPLSSMLVMFGLGLGVGVIVAQTVACAVSELAEEPTMTEKVKRQMADAFSHMISPQLLRQVQSYTHS